MLPSQELLEQISRKIKNIPNYRKESKRKIHYCLFLLGYKAGLRISEAVSFDYQAKHPRHKNLYLVHGKGNKKRYVYVSKEIIQELKNNHWKPNQTNRFAFNNFLKKVKERMNIAANVELTPHTLRRCFTTHNALNGVPMPVLQKVLGHKNIRTTSGYWKGSVDIRNFAEWLGSDSGPKESGEVPVVKIDNASPEAPKIPTKLENPSLNNSKELEYAKTIEKLKGEIEKKDKELEQKDLTIAEKDKQLRYKDIKISLLTTENRRLKTISQEKDQKLQELQEKVRQLTTKNKFLIENSTNLKNVVKNLEKIKEKQRLEIIPKSKAFLLDNLSKAKKPQNNPLVVKEKEQAELIAEIQVWKPPN